MTLAGHIEKIEGEKVWVLVSPEGVGCGIHCTCEKPVRRIETRTQKPDGLEPGEVVIVSTKTATGRGLLLAGFAIIGGIVGYVLGATQSSEVQAGLTIGGAFIIGIIGAAILSLFKKNNYPQTQKIQVQLH